MATTKLTYLNMKGRAEVLRFMFAQAGVDFIDNRIEPADWAEQVPGVQFGVPVLECDGEVLQSNGVIAKFLAAKFNMGGTTDEEKKAVAEIIDTTEEAWDRMSKFFWEKDPTKKGEMMKELVESYLPALLKKLEMSAVKNNSSDGWIVGQNVTCADLTIALMLDTLGKVKPEILAHFAALGKLKTSVEQLPNIAKWIASRPDTAH